MKKIEVLYLCKNGSAIATPFLVPRKEVKQSYQVDKSGSLRLVRH